MLQGSKTYLVAAAFAVVVFLQQMGYVTKELAETLYLLLGAGGTATLAAKVNRLSSKMILVPFLLLGFASSVQAQVVATDKLAWDQPAPDLATAQAYTYKYYLDAVATGITLTGVTCTSAGTPVVISCKTAFPAFTPGSHTLTITATNAAGESPKSAVYSFQLVVVPGAPTNIRSEK